MCLNRGPGTTILRSHGLVRKDKLRYLKDLSETAHHVWRFCLHAAHGATRSTRLTGGVSTSRQSTRLDVGVRECVLRLSDLELMSLNVGAHPHLAH